MNENVLEKLKILAESARYDVSCTSRANREGIVRWMAIEEITLSDGELLEQITSLP